MISGEHFGDQFDFGLAAKPAPLLSMSAYEKIARGEMLDFHSAAALHEPNAFTLASHSYGPNNVYTAEMTGRIPVPDFHYVNQAVGPYSNNGPLFTHEHVEQASRKRKASSSTDMEQAPPTKKLSIAQVHVQDPNGDYFDISGQPSPYSPFVPTPTASNTYQPGLHSPRPCGHHYSTSNASQVSLAAPSPHTPAWSPSFTTVKSEQSPQAPMTPDPRPASVASPVPSSIPKLVRTSTMQQSPPGISTNLVGNHQNFNPYAMYPLKASLKLKGDLDSMINDWTEDECEARRRLVEFKRSQSGSTINADFNPVTPQDRAPSSITISCIWWKEKKEYYVTSVDTIYLLEALVGVRFTVEEKNRIRRNLEGFRPMTISKAKQDSEEFFKVIMGFPHPKPRNIEKDVKVFPWKILSHALKKIISKYSASYSSTASALPTPINSGYTSAEGSVEYHYPPSPQSDIVTTAPHYAIMPNMGYSVPMSGRMSAPVTTAPVPDLQLQVPTLGSNYDMAAQFGGFVAMPNMTDAAMPMSTQAISAPPRMPVAWEFGNFVNDSPITTTPNSAPTTAYPREAFESAQFMAPTFYQMK